jgi:serine/threonine protein phosphatase PrpC
VAGVRHRLDGRPGEDAFGWAVAGDSVVVAVADGVSATPQAAAAAQAAVAGAVSVGAEGGERTPAERCRAALGGAIAAVVAEVGEATSGATTLVVAVVEASGTWAAARVGDSDALVLRGGGSWEPGFAAPPDGEGRDDPELRSGVTDALPAPGARRQSATGVLSPGAALVLVSDGVGEPLRDGPDTVARGLAAALAAPPAPLQLAALIDFARQGCHDDRTLVGVWRVLSADI